MPYRARPLVITFAAVSAALLLLGYLYMAREEPSSVKWDLSHSHTKSDVNWSGKSRSSWEISSAEYDITFSGGIHLTGKRMLRLDADPDTGTVDSVHIIYPKMSTDDAYRAAKELAKELSMDTVNVDRWYKQRTGGSEAGHEDVMSTSGMSPAKHTPGTPYIDASLLYSFEDERPTFIDLSFYWPKTEKGSAPQGGAALSSAPCWMGAGCFDAMSAAIGSRPTRQVVRASATSAVVLKPRGSLSNSVSLARMRSDRALRWRTAGRTRGPVGRG